MISIVTYLYGPAPPCREKKHSHLDIATPPARRSSSLASSAALNEIVDKDVCGPNPEEPPQTQKKGETTKTYNTQICKHINIQIYKYKNVPIFKHQKRRGYYEYINTTRSEKAFAGQTSRLQQGQMTVSSNLIVRITELSYGVVGLADTILYQERYKIVLQC